MDPISLKKIFISYFLTSFVIFFISAAFSVGGVFDNNLSITMSHFSVELIVLMQLSVVMVSNLVLHAIFYYGGFTSSPITRGIAIGAMLGSIYFIVGAFAFDLYDVNTGLSQLAGAYGGRLIEYGTGGIATAVISVTDIHKWGLLRAF